MITNEVKESIKKSKIESDRYGFKDRLKNMLVYARKCGIDIIKDNNGKEIHLFFKVPDWYKE